LIFISISWAPSNSGAVSLRLCPQDLKKTLRRPEEYIRLETGLNYTGLFVERQGMEIGMRFTRVRLHTGAGHTKN
jgi:hypothetical protein